MGKNNGHDTAVATRSQTVTDLRAELERKELPRHLALFYRSSKTQSEAVTAYIRQGLQKNQQCLYLADENTPDEVEETLRAANIDVDSRANRGDLFIREAEEVYLDSGFDPDRMIESLEEACEDSQEEGYNGLRLAGENTWCFHTGESFDKILDFEADFDSVCPELPIIALCQYDLREFDEESVAKALWTHKQVIYRNTLCENPYYIPPAEYQSTSDPYLNAQLMLEQTYALASAHHEVEQREQRLDVVNRVLRHNIRNYMNIVRGQIDLLRLDEELGDDSDERLMKALDHIEKMVEMSEKARYVQETLGTETLKYAELSSFLSPAVDRTTEKYSEARVEITGKPDVTVLADSNLDVALEELLTNAVIHQSSSPPEVSVTISSTEMGIVTIGISNPGDIIPESERRALQKGEETKLEHSSGLGLWFVKWIVENSKGILEFPTEGGPQVRVKLQGETK